MLVRDYQAKDYRQLIAGQQLICREGGAYTVNQFIPSAKWNEVLSEASTGSPHLLAVAVEPELNTLVGMIRLFSGEKHTLYQHVAEMGMFVLPKWRNKGVGTQMICFALAWAMEKQLEKITLSVLKSNTVALHLYDKFDFIQEGLLTRQIKDCRGNYLDLVVMARFL